MVRVLKSDIAIAGAGVIGLSLALELHSRGISVVLLDTAQAISGASRAAAGMLASEDPHNPPELRDLSIWSLSLYDRFLRRVEALSGTAVPYQTDTAVQYLDDGSTVRLAEKSIDPRQLAASAIQAVSNSGIPLLQDCRRIEINEQADQVELRPEHGPAISAAQLVHASGAWFEGPPKIVPRKGQMLRVRMPPGVHIDEVHRSSAAYAVPRRRGPQAGTVVIGATDEDAGFDLEISQNALDDLRARAAALIPALGSPEDAPQVEAWAGLRPATANRLPAIGRVPGTERQWLAGGHYRNGILLAPATAVAIADMLENRANAIDMRAFDPARLV
jgi:glycine oxidase